jgi:hypothetical protein
MAGWHLAYGVDPEVYVEPRVGAEKAGMTDMPRTQIERKYFDF